MSTPFIIGLGSRALVGKDFACDMLLKEFRVPGKRIAFADELKRDLDPLVREKLGFSAFTQDKAQKTLIRPLLVTYGTHVMRKHDNDYWVKRLASIMHGSPVVIIPDVRYMNELDWVLSQGGIVIDIDANVGWVNEEERINSPLIRAKASYRIFNDMSPESLRASLALVIENHRECYPPEPVAPVAS